MVCLLRAQSYSIARCSTQGTALPCASHEALRTTPAFPRNHGGRGILRGAARASGLVKCGVYWGRGVIAVLHPALGCPPSTCSCLLCHDSCVTQIANLLVVEDVHRIAIVHRHSVSGDERVGGLLTQSDILHVLNANVGALGDVAAAPIAALFPAAVAGSSPPGATNGPPSLPCRSAVIAASPQRHNVKILSPCAIRTTEAVSPLQRCSYSDVSHYVRGARGTVEPPTPTLTFRL